MRRVLLLALLATVLPASVLLLPPPPAGAIEIPPLEAKILDGNGAPKGKALIYFNYVEIEDAAGRPRGAIGVLVAEGSARLFLVQANAERKLIGWARQHRLFNAQNKLVGYYQWTPIWSYVYDADMKKVGQAQCLAYQGVCAAGVAGYLLGLL